MQFLSKKQKSKKAKAIKRLGFTDQDIIDAADSILDKEYQPYVNGVYRGKTKLDAKRNKERDKATEKLRASRKKAKEKQKAKGKKGKG